MKKPNNIDEYKKWLKKNHDVEISGRTENYYESVTSKIKEDFEKSIYWTQLNDNLLDYDADYFLKTGYHLMIPDFKPKLYVKSFDSFLLKTFRKNIQQNKNWPNEPETGWILPHNWYSKINDILRTLLIVKYLDGTEFLTEKMKSHCEQHNQEFNCYFEAREEGYYAVHLYTGEEFEIPRIDWDTERVHVSIEIQITTQIQEVIRNLLHKYYEEKRKTIKQEDMKWQWNYKNDEFTANYLGHILHYMEGMIMEIRDKQEERGKI